MEKLWSNLHLVYPKLECIYLHDGEQEIAIRRLLEKLEVLSGVKIDIDSILVEE